LFGNPESAFRPTFAINSSKKEDAAATHQCEWGRPVPHIPQERGLPLHVGAGAGASPLFEANTESFFASFVEPQCGHRVPSHLLDRTSTSLSRLHFVQ
jgi:hypothetical protein